MEGRSLPAERHRDGAPEAPSPLSDRARGGWQRMLSTLWDASIECDQRYLGYILLEKSIEESLDANKWRPWRL